MANDACRRSQGDGYDLGGWVDSMVVNRMDGQAMDEGILSLTQLLGYHTDSQSLIQLQPNPISPEILSCTRMSDMMVMMKILGLMTQLMGKEGSGQAEV